MILTVHVKPNARETKIIGWRDRATVIIAVKGKPKDGEANRELIRFFSKHYKVAKSLIEIKHGHNGRVKLISLPDQTRLD